jgi:hypothetical protein
MRLRIEFLVFCAMMYALGAIASAQLLSGPAGSSPSVVQATLTAPGSAPFQLKAIITEGHEPDPIAHVEMFWVSPDKWRRTIKSDDFSQTLIVNGDKVFEEDSGDYFPLGLQTLVAAMVDPKPILDALRPGDRLQTKANGASSESGAVSFGRGIIGTGPYGLMEHVGAAGHSVDFMMYENFKGKRVARLLINSVSVGDSLHAKVTELKELKNHDEALFSVAQPTPKEKLIRSVVIPEAEFRSIGLETHAIIWPQVLDGRTTGAATFYISLDRSGRVREVLPVQTDNERSNDSARRQIMRWKFKPLIKDGFPVQAESILTFTLNTRAWGPPNVLTDAEARKLASNVVEPEIPSGGFPAGTTETLMTAVDSDGIVIEVIAGDGPPALFQPCYKALLKWHFNPILQDGEPRPYRAEIKCQVH